MRRNTSVGWTYLKDDDVRRWYQNMARGSQKTADVALRNLGLFCTTMKTAPKALVNLTPKAAHDLLLDFISLEEARQQTGSSTVTRLKHVKSWLMHNGIRIDRPIKVARSTETPTLVDERTPSQDELHKVFLAGTLQSRVASVLMAHSGLRPEVLGNYLGNDGLRIKDLPDLRIEKKTVSWGQIPAMVVVRPELSKAGHKYFTFLGEEGCSYLKDYLEERMRDGPVLGPESDVFHPRFEEKQFIRTTNVGDSVRKALRAAGFKWRPYVLRAYFDTQLLLAESKGKVAHDYRVFWMGHKGSMESRYTTNKGRLPKDLIEDMRGAYRRCQSFLETVSGGQQENVPQEVAKAMLQLAGFGDEEIEKMDLSNLAAVRDQVRDRLGAASGPKQEVVSIGEISQRLAAGWQFVAALGTTQAILTSPSGPRTSSTQAASALPLRAGASPVLSAGQAAAGGSKGGKPPAPSGADGSSLALSLPQTPLERPGNGHSLGTHRPEPGQSSPVEGCPE